MVERGGGARLALEPLAPVGIAGELLRQNLEGDPSLQPDVVGEVDLAHASLAEHFDNSVVPEGGADHFLVRLPV